MLSRTYPTALIETGLPLSTVYQFCLEEVRLSGKRSIRALLAPSEASPVTAPVPRGSWNLVMTRDSSVPAGMEKTLRPSLVREMDTSSLEKASASR
ncbi:MAG: hypothetical protein BWX47_01855 [candidate division Hyd24-12 bacterium ADurb.Bin004]|nr:MAG: hypothetical protein BWX47_01855 [candidate division Hyd24-12 bacterium ADurb.Bin004]